MANTRLPSLRHKRSSIYAKPQAQLCTMSQVHAYGPFITHFSNIVKTKLTMAGWLILSSGGSRNYAKIFDEIMKLGKTPMRVLQRRQLIVTN